jgi:GNAT superfamily N-acetyltransferase
MPITGVKLRRADTVDKEAVQRISADAYIPAYMAVLGTIPKPATEDYGERIEKGEVWILEVEGEPTGVAILEEYANHLMIYSIAVKPDAQRKGYGSTLLDFADQRARAAPSSALHEREDGTKPNTLSPTRFCGSRNTSALESAWAGARRYGSETGTACVQMSP